MNVLLRLRKDMPITGLVPFKYLLYAAMLSDDYVLQSYGGFFTGAFVGLACVDYAGYDQVAEFRSFDYKELD